MLILQKSVFFAACFRLILLPQKWDHELDEELIMIVFDML